MVYTMCVSRTKGERRDSGRRRCWLCCLLSCCCRCCCWGCWGRDGGGGGGCCCCRGAAAEGKGRGRSGGGGGGRRLRVCHAVCVVCVCGGIRWCGGCASIEAIITSTCPYVCTLPLLHSFSPAQQQQKQKQAAPYRGSTGNTWGRSPPADAMPPVFLLRRWRRERGGAGPVMCVLLQKGCRVGGMVVAPCGAHTQTHTPHDD